MNCPVCNAPLIRKTSTVYYCPNCDAVYSCTLRSPGECKDCY